MGHDATGLPGLHRATPVTRLVDLGPPDSRGTLGQPSILTLAELQADWLSQETRDSPTAGSWAAQAATGTPRGQTVSLPSASPARAPVPS